MAGTSSNFSNSTNSTLCDNKNIPSPILEQIETSEMANFVEFSYPMAIANCIISMLLPIFTITGNLLLLVTVLKNRQLRKNVSNLLLVSLSITDLTVGVFIQPATTVPLMRVLVKQAGTICLFQGRIFFDVIGLLCTSASVQGLFLLNIDRYIAIVYPFKYPTLVTTRKTRYVIAASWTLSFFVTVLFIPEKTRSLGKTSWCVVAVLACLAIIVCHVKLAKVASKHKKSIVDQRNSLQQFQDKSHELKLFYTVGILTLALLVCFAPELALQFFMAYSRSDTAASEVSSEAKDVRVVDILHPWFLTLLMLNSAINPYLCFWRSKKFRGHIRELVYANITASPTTGNSGRNINCAKEKGQVKVKGEGSFGPN